MLLTQLGVGTYWGGEPGDAGGGVLLQLDVGAGTVEVELGEGCDGDVEARDLSRQGVERHHAAVVIALAAQPESEADACHAHVGALVEQLLEHRSEGQGLDSI